MWQVPTGRFTAPRRCVTVWRLAEQAPPALRYHDVT